MIINSVHLDNTDVIDTLRLRIPITPSIYLLMLKKAKEYKKTDSNTGMLDYVYYRNEIKVGSFNRDIIIIMPQQEKFYLSKKYQFVTIEISLPKYLYGHNAALLSASQIPYIFNKLYLEFKEFYGDFTHFGNWRIKRIDLCYAWRFQSEEIATHIINLSRPLKYPQKELVQYKTGVTNKGRFHNIKFYQKHPEYRHNDYQKLKDKGYVELAEEVLYFSKGIVRFEVKFEEEVYETHFGKPFLYYQDISDDAKLEIILRKHITTLFKFADRNASNNQTAKEKLEKIYDKNRAGDLYSMWKLIYSTDPTDQDTLKKNFSRWKVYRAKKELLKAGIGIPTEDIDISFDFEIPSPLVVIWETALAPAIAGSGVSPNKRI